MTNLTLTIPQFLKEPFFTDAKHSCIAAGRRTGKTYNAASWIILMLLQGPNRSGLWVDTKHANIDKYVDRYFKPILADVFHSCTWNQQKKILSFPNGSYLDFGSAEKPENLEGFDYDYMVINEAGIALKKQGLWDNTLQPMTKKETSRVRFIGTPKGRNKFHEVYVRGRSGDPAWVSHHFTVFDSPFWTKAEIDQIKPKVPEIVWKQEYMAEFIEGAGMVFRNISACVTDTVDKYSPSKTYLMGIDLAKHVDFTVMCVMEEDTHKVVHMDRFNQISWVLQKDRIKAMWKRWGRPRTIVDSTGPGDSVYDDLQSMGLDVEGFKFTAQSKQEIVLNLSLAFEDKSLRIPNIPEMIDELEIYEYQISKTGKVSYNAPDGFHDDIVMALALVWHLAKENVNVDITFI